VNSYLTEGHLPLLKDYSVFCLIKDFSPCLTPEIRDSTIAWSNAQKGIQGKKTDKKLAGELVQNTFGFEFGRLYVEKHFSEEDAPVIGFLGDLNVVFAIKRGEDIYEILKDNMLPPECDIIKLYHKACENLNRDVEFVIANTWYGGYGIVADGHHEASSVCFKHIWQVCADKLKDDLIIMIPRKDTVLFAPAGNKDIVEKMIDHGEKAYEQGENKISKKLLMFLREGKELITYEN